MSAVPKLRFREFTDQRELRDLGELFPQIRNGFVGTATPYYTKSGVPYLQGKNIKSGKVDDAGLIYVNQKFHDWQKKSQLKTNDVLMVQSGHVGECAVVPEKYVGGNCHALVVLSPVDDVHSQYFVEYFHAYAGKRQIHRITTGNTIQHILTSDLKPLPIPAPSLPEQKKIADFLGAVDDKIAGLRERERLLTQYKKGVMQKIFSQTLRFKTDDGSEFPDWEKTTLGEVAKVYQPKTISQSDLTHNGYVVYGANGVIGKYSEYNHETTQVTVTCRGNTCGTIGWTKPKAWITGNAMVINTDEFPDIVKRFLYYLLNFDDLRYLITGSGQPQITGDIKSHMVRIPHQDEQQKIADFLSAIDEKITAVSTQITQMQDFKKGLLQQMFV